MFGSEEFKMVTCGLVLSTQKRKEAGQLYISDNFDVSNTRPELRVNVYYNVHTAV
jgi:hypothetical protein